MTELLAWTSATASSSLVTLRATRMRFAPFAASWRAALRPMPSDAPVRRTVCSQAAGQCDSCPGWVAALWSLRTRPSTGMWFFVNRTIAAVAQTTRRVAEASTIQRAPEPGRWCVRPCSRFSVHVKTLQVTACLGWYPPCCAAEVGSGLACVSYIRGCDGSSSGFLRHVVTNFVCHQQIHLALLLQRPWASPSTSHLPLVDIHFRK